MKTNKNTKLVFSPKLVQGAFHPQFWICVTGGFTADWYPLLKSSLVRIGLCRSSELIPSFMKRYPILLTFADTIKLGMKQGLEDQTRAHRQGEFTNLSNIQNFKKCGWNVIKMWPILFQKNFFPQKAGNICIITRVLYNFWGLNFVKIRHKRRAEISITTSRTLAYRHFKQSKHQLILTPNRGSRDRQTAHTQIHQSSCQKLTPCFNGMLRIL